jgi:hypothetical protein
MTSKTGSWHLRPSSVRACHFTKLLVEPHQTSSPAGWLAAASSSLFPTTSPLAVPGSNLCAKNVLPETNLSTPNQAVHHHDVSSLHVLLLPLASHDAHLSCSAL